MKEYLRPIIKDFFYWCVDVIEVIGDITGLGYMLSNIALFIFLQPALILLFMWLWLKERKQNGR